MGGSCRDKVSLLKEICSSGGQQHLHITTVPQSLQLSEVAPFPQCYYWTPDVEEM